VPRETPLSEIHLENMLALARMGVVIAPPVPAFYHRPASVADIVDHTVARILDQLGLELPGASRWPDSNDHAVSPLTRRDDLPGGGNSRAAV
jgi:4-hydroxy-3-polyprenylbenzoate decarboxylase